MDLYFNLNFDFNFNFNFTLVDRFKYWPRQENSKSNKNKTISVFFLKKNIQRFFVLLKSSFTFSKINELANGHGKNVDKSNCGIFWALIKKHQIRSETFLAFWCVYSFFFWKWSGKGAGEQRDHNSPNVTSLKYWPKHTYTHTPLSNKVNHKLRFKIYAKKSSNALDRHGEVCACAVEIWCDDGDLTPNSS